MFNPNKMIRFYHFLLPLFFTAPVIAQPTGSLLWEISGNGLSQPSYIFGTIHLVPKKDYFFTESMQQAFKKSQVLVLEADMFSLSLTEKIHLATKAILPEGKTLKNFMDSMEYVKFRKLMKDSLGISEKKMDKKYARIKPFYLSALLLQEYVGKTKTYEQELYNYSKKQKMEIKGLETVDFQLGLVEHMSLEEQLEGINDFQEFRKFDELVLLYKQQDINGLYNLSLQSHTTETENTFRELFLNQRNLDWIPKIESLIHDNSCFIAVGALHLPGEQGVIEQLIKRGYSVLPVPASNANPIRQND